MGDYYVVKVGSAYVTSGPDQFGALDFQDKETATELAKVLNSELFFDDFRVVKVLSKPRARWALRDMNDGSYMKFDIRGGGVEWVFDLKKAAVFGSESEAKANNIVGAFVEAVEVML
jgi:hypothetical protein